MIVAGSTNPLLMSASTGYNLTRSLRFRSNAYLNRTPSTSGNRKTWTISTWVKRGALGTEQQILSGGVISGTYYYTKGLYFTSADKIAITNYPDTGGGELVSTAVYRDPSAWYHIVVAVDTTQATDTNRIKIYVNGVQVTSFSTTSYPAQNTDTMFNSTSYPMFMGRFVDGFTQYLDGYLAETNYIDGQALTPSSFGATSATTGVWQPKRYAGTYGTNGFYLPFTDNSALTTSSNVGLGKDFSGNGNYWTTNNISITAGSTYDSMTDVPTLTSATASNFATLNPLNTPASVTCTNGNLNSSGGNYASACSTIAPNSGKWYMEFSFTSIGSTNVTIGVSNRLDREAFNGNTQTWQLGYTQGGLLQNAGTNNSGFATYTTNDVIGVAFDCSAGTATWYKNNTLVGSLTNSAFANVDVVFGAGGGGSAGTNAYWVNFGQRPFAYTPPTGYVALNTFNLPTPTIGATASTQANKNFDVSLWNGDGSTTPLTVTNSGGFQPDLVWFKNRTSAYDHSLYDSVRGAGSSKGLGSNVTYAEGGIDGAYYGYLDSFTSNGFSLTAGSGPSPQKFYYVNQSSNSYVGWQWKASGSTVSNTAGSITSTVSANTSAGFSVVTYTGNGSAGATVGHGLGVAPSMVIVKTRSGVADWAVYHVGIGATKGIYLNQTAAAITSSNFWNNTAPSSTVFTMGGGVVGSSVTAVAYCFSEVAGYSKFGSYTGNGSTDGTFVYTGFRPKFIMVKRTDSTSNWLLLDTSRSPSNVAQNRLFPNLSNAEDSAENYDILSNGFKMRDASSLGNTGTLIYMAFAETPFRYSLAR